MAIYPNKHGRFGQFGGMYVPETLMPAIHELEQAYQTFKRDKYFQQQFKDCLKNFVGRPTPLYFAERLTKTLGGAKIYLKREDLCHTGAHKINNTVGQALLTQRMKKKRVIAENRCRATWRRRGNGGCDVWTRSRDLHGDGRYGTPSTQCLSACVYSAQK